MKLLWVTYFILNINAAIDTGKYQDISVEEVEDHIDGDRAAARHQGPVVLF